MTLRRWTVALLLTLVVPAGLLLPPAEVEAPRWARREAAEPLELAVGEASARLRAELLAWARRRAHEAVRHQGREPLAVSLVGPLPASLVALTGGAARQLWELVPVGDSTLRLHVVLLADSAVEGGVSLPLAQLSRNFVMPPPDTDGRTCVVAIRLPWGWIAARPVEWQRRYLVSEIRKSLGPCALWRAFGAPSPPIARWLGEEAYRPAQVATWALGGLRPRADWWMAGSINDPGTRWAADLARRVLGEPHPAYRMEVIGARCLAGRAGACEAALFSGGKQLPADGNPGQFGSPSLRHPLGGEGRAVLNDLIQERGRERFAAFWRSSAPLPEAFEAAFGLPAAEWTRAWMIRQYGVLDAGAPVLPTTAIVILVTCGLVALATAWEAGRRQAT